MIDKKILSIDSDDDNENYEEFKKFFEDDINRNKNVLLSEIKEMGGQLLDEIDRKRKNNELKKSKLIPFILKHSSYNKDELSSYSLEDVQEIHNEIKKERQSIIIKFFHFMFNLK